MENQINVYEAIAESDVAIFWEQLRAYFERDILPDPEDEDREYFLDGTEYRENIQKLHERPQNRCHYLFFHRDGQEIQRRRADMKEWGDERDWGVHDMKLTKNQ